MSSGRATPVEITTGRPWAAQRSMSGMSVISKDAIL